MVDLEAVADLDLERAHRRGYPEAVYCEHKSAGQLRPIAIRLRETSGPAIFTRISRRKAGTVLEILPDARYEAAARILIWPATPLPPSGELVVVACAGTSDLPVAQEAELTARHLGRRTELIVDIGVAGLHRILSRLPRLRQAGAIVVVAGMDGALPSLIAGLVRAPVVAVPTSVGYGAAFGGVAPLLTMLNSCAPGVAVVNIDNGYGAGHLAAQIAAPRDLESSGA